MNKQTSEMVKSMECGTELNASNDVYVEFKNDSKCLYFSGCLNEKEKDVKHGSERDRIVRNAVRSYNDLENEYNRCDWSDKTITFKEAFKIYDMINYPYQD